MKRLLTLTAFLAVFCACNKHDDSHTPEPASGTVVNVSVVAHSNDDTQTNSRVSVTDDWAVYWIEGESLMSYDGTDVGEFTMTTYGESVSTFTGTVKSDYRLVHPYDDAPSIDGSLLTVDVSTQTAGATLTYMTTEEMLIVDATESTTPSMKHIGAVVVLELKFDDDSYNGCTVEKATITGLTNSCVVDLTEELTGGDFYGTATREAITVNAENLAISEKTASMRFNILPTSIEPSDEVKLDLVIKITANKYLTFSKIISNTGSDAIAFERATWNTLGYSLSSDYLQEATVSTGSIIVGAGNMSDGEEIPIN